MMSAKETRPFDGGPPKLIIEPAGEMVLKLRRSSDQVQQSVLRAGSRSMG